MWKGPRIQVGRDEGNFGDGGKLDSQKDNIEENQREKEKSQFP